MAKKKGKKGKSSSKKKKPPAKKPEKKRLEEEIKAFIGSYIDSYMNQVEELNLEEADFPLFYTHYPFDVEGYILPDDSTCILFRGLAETTTIAVEKADFEFVDSKIEDKNYDHICCYPPSQPFTNEEAELQAKNDVELDVDNARSLFGKEMDSAAKEETLRSVRFMGIGIPFMAERAPSSSSFESDRFLFDNLKIGEEEDFSAYSQRLKNTESSYFHPEEEIPAVQEEPEPEPEPLEFTPKEKKPEIEEEAPPIPPQPPPPPPAAEDTSKTTTVTIPPPGAPGTNISIEIKQPETGPKGEQYEAKSNEILRLKKTLLTQTIELEDMKKKMLELEGKVGNVEHMRQTVFRMNRKVHDSEVKMDQMAKSNEDVLIELDEMRHDQREENKKTRRFITEKAKKARNQALTVAIIAIIISALSLPFLIMLVIRYWSEIKSMLGL
jgi:hypothetical protein